MLKVKTNNTNEQKEFFIENTEGKFLLNEKPFEWDSVQIDENTYHSFMKTSLFWLRL